MLGKTFQLHHRQGGSNLVGGQVGFAGEVVDVSGFVDEEGEE